MDYNEVMWDNNVEPIVNAWCENGITEFTISSTFTGLLETPTAFEDPDCYFCGLTKVKAGYTDRCTVNSELSGRRVSGWPKYHSQVPRLSVLSV